VKKIKRVKEKKMEVSFRVKEREDGRGRGKAIG
jgi:hypothetical protein